MIIIQSKVYSRIVNNSIKEKMINVNRVTKVVKGRRIMSFVTLVVVGDGNGFIGMGKGKSKEIPVAAQKASDKARRNMRKVILNNGTLYYELIGKHGASTIFMFPAKIGTGIIAGGSVRSVFSVMGITNIIAKSNGSTNPYNIVRATLNGLYSMNTPELISAKRDKKIF